MTFHSDPTLDLSPVLSHLRPAATQPPPVVPTVTRQRVFPLVLTAVCTPPVHRCDAPRQRALCRSLPLLITHLHEDDTAAIKLLCHRPLELSAHSRDLLLHLFGGWAGTVPFDSTHACTVEATTALFKVPSAIATVFAQDVLVCARFERVLP